MRRSPVIPYTRPAMEAGEFAKSKGLFDPYHRALFKAYWEAGRNLGETGVLLEQAERVGLDSRELATALEEGRYTETVEGQVQFARSVGINGIPAFIIDRYLFTGAQPYPIFKQVMDKVLEEREAGAGK